jgi:RecB family exonuclease
MALEKIFEEINEDLPWCENSRLVVGPLASRETVKDALLDRTPIVPAWAAGTLSELANDLLRKSEKFKDKIRKPLSAASQCDALVRVAQEAFLKERLPALCQHLRARPVALKIARFLTELDRFYAHNDELDAIIEYFQGKDESLGTFIQVIRHLWSQGELHPWGEGNALREAVACLDEEELALPKRIHLWGFFEFTPLEERLLEKLSARGVALLVYFPETIAEKLSEGCKRLGAQAVPIANDAVELRLWQAHSVWDELEFLQDELRNLRSRGVAWSEIAVFVPNDDLYKRLARQKLQEWRVPLRDPTLSGGWRDRASWVRWRDLFRVLATGLKTEDVRTWLASTAARDRCKPLFDDVVLRGVHGGVAQWAKLFEKHDIPELRVLIESAALFGRSMRPTDFLEASEKLQTLLTSDLEDSNLPIEFAQHLVQERPYLSDFKARLPRYVALFEEYLESKARTESLRAPSGLSFIGHGVWLPTPAKHAIVLGTNLITRARPSADRWDWEGVEVRRAWEKLHLGLSWADRVERDEAILKHGLFAHRDVVVSSIDYGLRGEPYSKGAVYHKLVGQTGVSEKSGGHPRVGWTTHAQPSTPDNDATSPVLRPDLIKDGSQRVSSFEDYLRCPFLYYSRHVLQLNPEDDLGLDPDGRARGNVLHNVLRRFVEAEIEGEPRCTLEQAKQKLSALVEEEVRRQPLSGMFRHKPLVDKAILLLKSYAARWAEWEYANREKHPDLKPFAVEIPVEVEILPGFQLKGRADRVDSDGKHQVVIDYKTGQAPYTGKELAEGLGAQLLVYATGVQAQHKLEPAGAHYLTVGRKVESSRGVFLKKHNKRLFTTTARNSGFYDGEYNTLFERVTENWMRAAADLKRGQFSPQPARGKKDCDACLYQSLCGFQPADEVDGE